MLRSVDRMIVPVRPRLGGAGAGWTHTPLAYRQLHASPFLRQQSVIGRLDRKLEMTMTCEPCGTRSSHQFRAKTYETGVVIIQCPNPTCKARHLVADRLGWFEDVKKAGGDGRKGVDIEELMRRKGEAVKRGEADVLGQYTDRSDGLVELTAEDLEKAA